MLMSDNLSHLFMLLVNLSNKFKGLKNVLVHAKIPNSDLDIESAIIFHSYAPFCQSGIQHFLMCNFTLLNFRNQPSSGLCEVAHGAS